MKIHLFCSVSTNDQKETMAVKSIITFEQIVSHVHRYIHKRVMTCLPPSLSEIVCTYLDKHMYVWWMLLYDNSNPNSNVFHPIGKNKNLHTIRVSIEGELVHLDYLNGWDEFIDAYTHAQELSNYVFGSETTTRFKHRHGITQQTKWNEELFPLKFLKTILGSKLKDVEKRLLILDVAS